MCLGASAGTENVDLVKTWLIVRWSAFPYDDVCGSASSGPLRPSAAQEQMVGRVAKFWDLL